ncbi:MFS transporter prlL [Colletotrichum sp. SAR 10_65]|nr:MFS transporter prlL [Colletotrichum sp. SAR 10_65]KAI8212922.1 MFS transporter prlL [Colletotrichum sp. SAR 10_76]KAI8258151.1 MFS transporter prlL [Colletotrichum sp. SAR 10_77]
MVSRRQSSSPSMEANDQKDMGNEPQHIETSGQTMTWTEEEEKALVKKIDLFLMPTIWLMYLLSYMDRTNIGNAKIAGMADDIGLSSSQYSIVLVVFFNEKLGKGKSFMLALRDWRTWGFIFGYMVIVGSSTLSYFYPTLVHGLGFTSTVQAQYMTVPIYAFAFVCTAITGYFGDKIPDHRGLVIAAWLAFSMITSIIVCVVYNFTARYVLLVLMAAGLWASNAMSLSFASSTFGSMDAEVRAIALALMNALGNLAQIYGAYLFPTDDAPKYLMGFGVISGMLGFGTVVYVIMHILVRRWKP